MINYTDGDLIELAKGGEFNVIAHGANCFCVMGSGIAAQIKKAFPEAYAIDSQTERGAQDKLGTITVAECDCCDVVNAYTQFSYGNGNDADYDAIRNCMRKVKQLYSGKRIGMPFIGAGLAGGSWKVISQIIEEELGDEDITVVRYKKC